jgi:hypothetical protein
VPRQTNFSRFDHPKNFGWVQIIKLLIKQCFPLPCYLVPLRPYILFSTLFSNNRSLRSSFNVSAQFLHVTQLLIFSEFQIDVSPAVKLCVITSVMSHCY